MILPPSGALCDCCFPERADASRLQRYRFSALRWHRHLRHRHLHPLLRPHPTWLSSTASSRRVGRHWTRSSAANTPPASGASSSAQAESGAAAQGACKTPTIRHLSTSTHTSTLHVDPKHDLLQRRCASAPWDLFQRSVHSSPASRGPTEQTRVEGPEVAEQGAHLAGTLVDMSQFGSRVSRTLQQVLPKRGCTLPRIERNLLYCMTMGFESDPNMLAPIISMLPISVTMERPAGPHGLHLLIHLPTLDRVLAHTYNVGVIYLGTALYVPQTVQKLLNLVRAQA